MRLKKPGPTLKGIVEQVKPELALISDLESKVKRGSRWSKREVMGHLIDSASINHNRFVMAQMKDELVFDGYDQDEWVAAQGYQEVQWKDLVGLWARYNLHLAHMINKIPRDKLTEYRDDHNLDIVAWKRVPDNKPITLRYFIWDYIGHMEHHLRRVMPTYKPIIIDNY